MGELWLPNSEYKRPKLRFCECCSDRPGDTTRTVVVGIGGIPTTQVLVALCPHCRHANEISENPHTAGYCRSCYAKGRRPSECVVWRCHRLAHAKQYHPEIVERGARDDFADEQKEPVPYILGTVEVDSRPDGTKKFY